MEICRTGVCEYVCVFMCMYQKLNYSKLIREIQSGHN